MSSYQAWKAFERELVRRLKANGFEAQRNWSSQFAQKDGLDVIAPPYGIQVKHGLKPNLVGAYREAKRDGQNLIPVGVVRFKGTRESLVCLNLDTFLQLIRA